jgi:tetratricopeptide (TPR) repeat protein
VARKTDAGHTLEQLQTASDRLAVWLDRNAFAVLGGALALLLLAGLAIFLVSRGESAEESASSALSKVRDDYRAAMGASPEDATIPEPANPETARRVRTEYRARFAEVAERHPGTAAAALALLETGEREHELGEPEAALRIWTEGEAALPRDHPVRAFFLRRIGAARESQSAWAEAAQAYEAAAGIEAYPLRYSALADAARCYAEAGDAERAIAAFERIEREAPDVRTPPYVAARIRELRARRDLAAAPAS